MTVTRQLWGIRTAHLSVVVGVLGVILGVAPAVAGGEGFGLGLDRTVPPVTLSGPGATPEVVPPRAENPPQLLSGSVEERPGFPKRLWKDLGATVTAPARWERSDWGRLGLGVLAVGAVSLVDEPVSDWVDEHRSSGVTRSAKTIRPLGQEGGLVLVGAAWLAGHVSHGSELEAVGEDGMEATIIAAGLISPVLKLAVGRQRPRQTDDPRSFGSGGESFPSGEATEAFAIAAVVAAHSERTWVRATAWGVAGLVGLERMELDAHWASDVVAGALIGAAVGRWVVKHNRPERESGPRVSVTPTIGAQRYGVVMNATF